MAHSVPNISYSYSHTHTHSQSVNHAHSLRPSTTSVSITAFTPVMLSGQYTKPHTKHLDHMQLFIFKTKNLIIFNLALFMRFIKGHTCTLTDVDTDRRAT